MISPGETYASLARMPGRSTPLAALRRPLVVALVLGVTAAIGATRHLTPALLLSTTVCWSFVLVVQVAIALILIAGPARRTVGLARALDLYFAGHAPWSLWMLAAAAWAPSPLGRPFTPLLIAAAVPIVLTPRILSAFFREVLEMDPRRAAARTAAQQVMTWVTFVLLFGTAVQLVPRVLEWFA
ncbi:MAG TPA: hypothetical protein VF921_07200 [Vicinamibacterales bacterium]